MDEMREELNYLIFVCDVLQSRMQHSQLEKDALIKIQKILELINELLNIVKEPVG